MVNPMKADKVEEIKGQFSEASSMVLTDYRGLNVSDLSELRRVMDGEGVVYKVVKNSLAQRAAADSGMECLIELLEGPTAIAFGSTDPIAPARLVNKFAKGHEALMIKGGYMDGALLTAEQVIVLANLPGREQLLSMLAGVLQGPVAKMARVLNAPMQGFAACLSQVAERS